jgi:phage tail tape-measure protein
LESACCINFDTTGLTVSPDGTEDTAGSTAGSTAGATVGATVGAELEMGVAIVGSAVTEFNANDDKNIDAMLTNA